MNFVSIESIVLKKWKCTGKIFKKILQYSKYTPARMHIVKFVACKISRS